MLLTFYVSTVRQGIIFMDNICKSCTAFGAVQLVGKYKGLCQVCHTEQERMDIRCEGESLRSEAVYAFFAAVLFIAFAVLFYFIGGEARLTGSRWAAPLVILTNLFGQSAAYLAMIVMPVLAAAFGSFRYHQAGQMLTN